MLKRNRAQFVLLRPRLLLPCAYFLFEPAKKIYCFLIVVFSCEGKFRLECGIGRIDVVSFSKYIPYGKYFPRTIHVTYLLIIDGLC